MRRLALTAVVFALAAAGPVAVIAGACGDNPPCCKAAPSAEETISRGSCCPTPCIDTARDTEDATVHASTFQPEPLRGSELPDEASVTAVAATDETPSPFPSPPSTARRLATLSLLLI